MSMHMIAPIPKLAELREAVLARSEKRQPKWGFRISDDVVMELQPQPCLLLSASLAAKGHRQAVLCFEGQAVMAEGAGEAALKRLPRVGAFRKRTFSVVQFAGDPDWQLALKHWVRTRKDDPGNLERLDAAILATLQDDGIFAQLTPESMLRPACMICGKGLTDPASMASWIGPECAATTSIRIFWERANTKPIEVLKNAFLAEVVGGDA